MSTPVDDDDFSVTIHQSLNRPMLLLGGERNLVLMLAVLAGVFIFSLMQLWAFILGVTLWMAGTWILSRAGQFDHQLSKTGPRSLRYKRFYPSASTPFAPNREIQ